MESAVSALTVVVAAGLGGLISKTTEVGCCRQCCQAALARLYMIDKLTLIGFEAYA